MLPEELHSIMEEEAKSFSLKQLLQAREQLTRKYHNKEKVLISTEAERVSYLLTRMPATFAVNQYCLNQLKHFLPNETFHTFLDVGAGPGTSSWAAINTFPAIEKICLIEKDQGMVQRGQKLFNVSSKLALKNAQWFVKDLQSSKDIPASDLMICSYSLGEMPENQYLQILNQLWSACNKALIIIEPGSVEGFRAIRTMRSFLIQEGATMLAPCPHDKKCPMPENDWCHFSVKLERSWLHRHLKQGSLPFEEEKFSYVVASKLPPVVPRQNRVLKPVEKHSGHVRIPLCTLEGTYRIDTISKKDKERYKLAKKLEWGELFE